MKNNYIELLKSSQIFSSLSEAELVKLSKKFKKITLSKNKILFRQGEMSHDLFLLVSGKIAVFLRRDSKDTVLINEVLPGTLIGEITALSHHPRMATAKAVEKSVLLQLSSDEFIALCKKFSAIGLAVINKSLGESRDILKLMSEKGQLKKHIAIVPANKQVDLSIFQDEILKNNSCSDVVFLSDIQESTKLTASKLQIKIDKLDKNNKTIVYIISSYESPLAKICFDLERVDMIYVVAFDDSKPMMSRETHHKIDNNKYKIKPELVLLHKRKKTFPANTSKWLRLEKFNLNHHIRIDQSKDWERLFRFITGNAVGVVLGGGGLRCWAQLGALRALNKLNIPVDAIGGSSAGSIFAGFYAMNQSLNDAADLRELSEVTREIVSLKDITWPAISVFDGENYTKKLQKMFGNKRLENLWIPCFCVSTNLATNRLVVSRSGYLWKVIRSSTSVPLVFPPVVVNGKLHMDGGLLNNLPVDVMRNILSNKGQVIAVELTHAREDNKDYFFPPVLPFWSTMLTKFGWINKNYVFPHLIETFLKSLLAGASAKQRENSLNADVLITPDLSSFKLLNVSKKDENKLIKIGYETTLKQLKKSKK